MDAVCEKMKEEASMVKIEDKTLCKDDVVQQNGARATKTDNQTEVADGVHPPKKRKTRRGKSKRKQPYQKNSRKCNKLIKPEAPHNSNQFLLEDHGTIEDLDNLKNIDQVSTSTITRTRDSSFSVDSDGEFYSSPDDEEQFLIKDFDDQYESLHAERLQSMSKEELVEEYLQLENKLEQLSKRLQTTDDEESVYNRPELKQEVERLTIENERLRRENEALRSKVHESDSEDSETDSSDSCSSSSSSSNGCSSCSTTNSSRSRSPIHANYSPDSGHVPNMEAKVELV